MTQNNSSHRLPILTTLYVLKTVLLFVLVITGGWLLRSDKPGRRR
ncbi:MULTISPECIES: hypothetical protein [Spirosoma]|nr:MULTISPECIES: hypothetical protein [Spirosoma]